MAVYTVNDAITYARAIVVGVPVAAIQIVAADMVNSIIWNAYPWRWARKNFSSIPLVDGQQDYAFMPADCMRLASAGLIRTDLTPNAIDSLTIVRNLDGDLGKAGFRGGLSLISLQITGTTSQSLRLNMAAAVPTGNLISIQGQYQFTPVKLIATSDSFPFADQYFSVFLDGLLWQFMMLAKDSRAGTAQSNGKGGVAYTGQMGIFYDSLVSMKEAEDWGAGDTIYPSEPLGQGGGSWSFSGIYGP